MIVYNSHNKNFLPDIKKVIIIWIIFWNLFLCSFVCHDSYSTPGLYFVWFDTKLILFEILVFFPTIFMTQSSLNTKHVFFFFYFYFWNIL